MRMSRGLLAIIVVTLLPLACGKEEKKTESPSLASCTFTGAGICSEGIPAADTQSSCEAAGDGATIKGTYAAAACSRTGAVGTCAEKNSSGASFTTVYSSPHTTATAQTECTKDGGTFTAISG